MAWCLERFSKGIGRGQQSMNGEIFVGHTDQVTPTDGRTHDDSSLEKVRDNLVFGLGDV
jgi:hypothetical protein